MNLESEFVAHQKERAEKVWFKDCWEPKTRSRTKDLTGYIFQRRL